MTSVDSVSRNKKKRVAKQEQEQKSDAEARRTQKQKYRHRGICNARSNAEMIEVMMSGATTKESREATDTSGQEKTSGRNEIQRETDTRSREARTILQFLGRVLGTMMKAARMASEE